MTATHHEQPAVQIQSTYDAPHANRGLRLITETAAKEIQGVDDLFLRSLFPPAICQSLNNYHREERMIRELSEERVYDPTRGLFNPQDCLAVALLNRQERQASFAR